MICLYCTLYLEGVISLNLGNSLFESRKKVGLSQEVVAERLGVSRQTISKWETNETVPDIYLTKKLSTIKLKNL